jgi:hypothetical protein
MLQIFYESQDFFLVNSSVNNLLCSFQCYHINCVQGTYDFVPNVKMSLFVTVAVVAFLPFFCLFAVLNILED